jgi:hypothetical protein
MWPDAEQDSHLQSALTRRVTARTQTRCSQMAVSHIQLRSWPIHSHSHRGSCWFRQSLNQSVISHLLRCARARQGDHVVCVWTRRVAEGGW